MINQFNAQYRGVAMTCITDDNKLGELIVNMTYPNGIVPEEMKSNYRFTCQPGKEQNALPSVYKSLCAKIDVAYPQDLVPQAFMQTPMQENSSTEQTMKAQDTAANAVNSIPPQQPSASSMQSGGNRTHTVPPQSMQYQQSRKKKRGCLIGCGMILGLFIILMVIGALGAPIYFLNNDSVTSQTTSNSGQSSKTEEEEAVEFAYEETDRGFVYYENSIGDTEYYAFVEITNTGSVPIYLDECSFDFEDAEGHLLETETFIDACPEVIAPGEKGYFRNDAIASLLDDGISTDGIQFVPKYKVVEATSAPVYYEVTDTDIRVDDSLGMNGVKVTGRVTNNTDEEDSLFYLNVIFYDSDGKCIGFTGTNITEFEPGDTESFECTTVVGDQTITMDRVAEYKVIAQKSHYQW